MRNKLAKQLRKVTKRAATAAVSYGKTDRGVVVLMADCDRFRYKMAKKIYLRSKRV